MSLKRQDAMRGLALTAQNQLPDLIPKKWIATCETCLLHWIPSFKHGACPACAPRKG